VTSSWLSLFNYQDDARSNKHKIIRIIRFACWIPKATNTHSEYVILIAFPLQQCLKETASVLRYMCIASHVRIFVLIAHLIWEFHKWGKCGPGSPVGITTVYGLDDPDSNPGGDEIIRPSRPALGPTQSPVKWVPGFSGG